MTIIYCDMCADLLHYGHINYLKHAKSLGDKLYVGIHNDETMESYKRPPILTMEERIQVLATCKYIDKIIPNAPLHITDAYMDTHQFDVVVTPNNRTDEECSIWYSAVMKRNMLVKIPYTEGISTTQIINRILDRYK